MTAHQPVMPLWTCDTCRLPWPCPPRRQQLLTEYQNQPGALALLLGWYLVTATQDLTWIPAETLHRRFTGWIRSARQ